MLKQTEILKTIIDLIIRLDIAGKQRVFCRPWPPGIFQAGEPGARRLKHQEGGGSKGQPKADDQVLRGPAGGGGVGGCCGEGGAGGR